MHDFVDVARVVELARHLVAADSQNPPGGERAAADVARQALEPLGATFNEVEPEPGRVSLVATVGAGDGSRPTLLVNGHLDVVPVDPTAWQHDPFAGEVHDGRMFGRGTADMKGGIACAIEALDVLRRAGREPACDVTFHLVADEEQGGALGTRVLLEQGLIGADACIDPEPTSLGLCLAERGVLSVAITTRGTPGHGSQPHRGVSAVEKAAKIVLALHGAEFGDPEHELLGRPSCNVGVIHGGTSHNVIAERCRIVLDRRVLPGTTQDDAVAALRRKVDDIDDPDLRYDMEVVIFGEASEIHGDDPFVAWCKDAYRQVLGTDPPIVGMHFTTDARFVRNQAGIPAVVCGPGDIDQAHVVDESVAVDRLADATALYAHLYATFGS